MSVRDGGTVIKKAVYVALGVRVDGSREVLGLWMDATEGARFWLRVLTDLKNRGVQDMGLSGILRHRLPASPRCVVRVRRSAVR